MYFFTLLWCVKRACAPENCWFILRHVMGVTLLCVSPNIDLSVTGATYHFALFVDCSHIRGIDEGMWIFKTLNREFVYISINLPVKALDWLKRDLVFILLFCYLLPFFTDILRFKKKLWYVYFSKTLTLRIYISV